MQHQNNSVLRQHQKNSARMQHQKNSECHSNTVLEEAKHADIIHINLVAMKTESDATRDAFQTQLTRSQMQFKEERENFNKIQIDP